MTPPKHTSEEDLDGLDESQRAEVHEYEGGGPTDGVILTDMSRDRGEDYVEDDQDGEMVNLPLDALGRVDRPPERLDPPRSFQLTGVEVIGGYALRPTWGDGHGTGLYPFPLLRRLGSDLEDPAAAGGSAP